MPVTVHDIAMAAPDMLMVEFHDGDVTWGEIEAVGASLTNNYDTWFDRSSRRALNIGPLKDSVRYEDDLPDAYLDTDTVDVAANWPTINGLAVTAVYRKTNGWKYREGDTGVDYGMQMWHKVFLKLSGNLAQGPHIIEFPAALGLADSSFTFDDTRTRCEAIHTNHNGHRPGDVAKRGFISLWLPSTGAASSPDLVTDYSVTEFQIIDGAGTVHFTGTPTLRVAPTDAEAGMDMLDGVAGTNTEVTPDSTPFATITSITAANPAVVTYVGTDPAEDQQIYFDYINGTAGTNLNYRQDLRANNVNAAANTFEVQIYSGGVWIDRDTSGLTHTADSGRIFAVRSK